ncbi:MAG: phospho-sugar mutase [Clostridia bacterium]|nr:phospho-sugar mutase [Clostridia bacterium]
MSNIQNLYELWKKETVVDKELYQELVEIEDNVPEIEDRFYKSLEFGTAGLRGVLGAGTNRMNIYTVNQATQGLATYLNSTFENPSVAIAYDSRINSDVFAKSAAGVLAANNIKVYIYKELMPTPMLSFAVRRLSCKSGIIITASHNPSKYNGYNCYDPNGYQMTDEAAKKTYEFIQKTDIFNDVKTMDFDEAMKSGLVEYISDDIIDEFYDKVRLQSVLSVEDCKKADLKVIYSPLNGAGNKPVRNILKSVGIDNITVVASQENPDGNFPTCPYPNPEIRQVFEEAIELSKTVGGDLLLATDPDCDRVGIAVLHEGKYTLMNGNEIGAMLAEFVLSRRKDLGTLPEKPIILKSIVTSKIIEKIAENYGATVHNLLTGFKYVGEFITNLEANGEEDRFVLGMEESYGYLAGTHDRDKDAVVASMLICEMAAYYKLKGMTLIDFMESIYNKYGMYCNSLSNFAFEGMEGMEKMQNIMADLRNNPPSIVAGFDIVEFSDYKTSEKFDKISGEKSTIDLPSSNVLSYTLDGGYVAIIRPSGTEPKIKLYITTCGDTRDEALSLADSITEDFKKILKIQ